MSKTKICPVCGYDESRDAARHPALARLRQDAIPFGGEGAALYAEVIALRARVAELEALLEDLSPPPVLDSADPSLWTAGKTLGSIRPRPDAVLPDVVFVPASWNGEPVTRLEDYAFQEAAVRRVVLPEGLQSVGWHCFTDCRSLVEVVLTASLARIERRAFNGCTRLTRVIIPEGIAEIDQGTFFGCASLREVRLPSAIRRIGKKAFVQCESLESIDLPEGLESIGTSAFAGCTSLRALCLPSTLKRMGDRAFAGCTGLRELEMRGDPATWYPDAFAGCWNLERASLPAAFSWRPLNLPAGCRVQYWDR